MLSAATFALPSGATMMISAGPTLFFDKSVSSPKFPMYARPLASTTISLQSRKLRQTNPPRILIHHHRGVVDACPSWKLLTNAHQAATLNRRAGGYCNDCFNFPLQIQCHYFVRMHIRKPELPACQRGFPEMPGPAG